MSQTKKSEIIKDQKVTPIKTADKKKVFIAPEDIVAELHAANVMYDALKNQLANMIETHSKDEKDMITTAPIFLGLIESAVEDKRDSIIARYNLEDTLPVDEGYVLTEWTCDYETRKVTYEVVKEDESIKKKIMTVPEDVCNAVWIAQLRQQVAVDVITWLNDSHARDSKDTITKSPVFKDFTVLMSKYMKEYEETKQDVYEKMVPTVDKMKYTAWQISFKTGELTLTE